MNARRLSLNRFRGFLFVVTSFQSEIVNAMTKTPISAKNNRYMISADQNNAVGALQRRKKSVFSEQSDVNKRSHHPDLSEVSSQSLLARNRRLLSPAIVGLVDGFIDPLTNARPDRISHNFLDCLIVPPNTLFISFNLPLESKLPLLNFTAYPKPFS
jgi:hypothetical protein